MGPLTALCDASVFCHRLKVKRKKEHTCEAQVKYTFRKRRGGGGNCRLRVKPLMIPLLHFSFRYPATFERFQAIFKIHGK